MVLTVLGYGNVGVRSDGDDVARPRVGVVPIGEARAEVGAISLRLVREGGSGGGANRFGDLRPVVRDLGRSVIWGENGGGKNRRGWEARVRIHKGGGGTRIVGSPHHGDLEIDMSGENHAEEQRARHSMRILGSATLSCR